MIGRFFERKVWRRIARSKYDGASIYEIDLKHTS